MLEIRNLHKKYGKRMALDGLDLGVQRGETVVIMGPSGCGKSTAIRCINRLTEPDSGEIILDGKPVLRMNDDELHLMRRKIGFVFQHFNLIHRLTVLENVMLGLVMAGCDKETARQKAASALDRVGLSGELDRKPDELSGGQKQRAGIARAIAFGPELMLWDEPTASLDPILVREVLDVMEELVSSSRTTMVIVTHEVSFARRVADRIVLMDKGRVVEEGPPSRVFSSPVSEIGAKYVRLLAS